MAKFSVYNSPHDFMECELMSLALACKQALEIADANSYGAMGFIQVIAPWNEVLGKVEKEETFSTLFKKCIDTVNNR